MDPPGLREVLVNHLEPGFTSPQNIKMISFDRAEMIPQGKIDSEWTPSLAFWFQLQPSAMPSGLAFCVTMEASVLEPIGLSIDQFGFEPKMGKWGFRVFGLSLERD